MRVTLAIALVLAICACSKEDNQFDSNEILYGEWDYHLDFKSIYEDNLEINYTVLDDELVTFFRNTKAEIYNDKIPVHLSIDSFFYRINENRDTFFTKTFFQYGEYFEGYSPNTGFRAQLIDSFSNDYFRIQSDWTNYIEEEDRTIQNTSIIEYSRK